MISISFLAAAEVWRGWDDSLGCSLGVAGVTGRQLRFEWGVFHPGSGCMCGFWEVAVKCRVDSSSEPLVDDARG